MFDWICHSLQSSVGKMPCLCIVLMSFVSLFPTLCVCVCVCTSVSWCPDCTWGRVDITRISRRVSETNGRSEQVAYRHQGSGNTDHGHWENTLNRNRESTLTRSMHGDLSAYCFCFTVNKRTVFYVESPASGYSLRTPDRIFICDKVIDKSC